MTVLAFDTSGSVLSLTLLLAAADGRSESADGTENPRAVHLLRDTGLRHAEHLAGAARDLLAAAGLSVADVDLIACAGGPGSFTGLRIGMATAKGFAAARNIPFVAVPTLDIWAELYRYWPGVVVPVLDARKRRFYAAVYAGVEKLTADLDEDPESILELAREAGQVATERLPPGDPRVAGSHAILIVGPDAAVFGADVGPGRVVVAPPSDSLPSHALARIAVGRYHTEGTAPTGIGPSYVRKSDAELGA
ncbi:MAG: tRNA (adenosine(37)-N6)-threonylcarbamoyltransferase complex dimerization subunit type 1 TsaB [Spirochaetes bacterium]|nr:tRNA (adenosine(37)-N6)-threonylcarbamoyltransferase complex dimerization subunit type 1 TsaB [Spirochaetota bacterium]